MTSTGRRNVAAAVAVSTACVLPPFLVGALSVRLRADLNFGEAALGLAVGVSFLVAAASSTFAGRLVERVGARAGMRVATAVSAVALTGMALSPSFTVLTAFLAVGGVGNAAAQSGSNLLLARGVAPGRQGTAFGIKQSAIPAAMLLGGLAVPTVGLTVGWRWAFAGAGVLALAAALVVPPSPRSPARVGRVEHTRVTPTLVMLALAGGLGATSANTLGAFLVASAVHDGVSEGSAGLLYALGSVVGLGARVLVGMAGDRSTRADPLPVVAAMLAGGAGGFALLATDVTAAIVPAVVVAFGLGWGWPGLFNWAVVRRYPKSPAAATGITQTGVYLGALAGPLAFGLLAEHLSYGAAWTFAASCSVAAAVAVVAAGRYAPAVTTRVAPAAPVA